jgi:ubiquinone/menaquinone biosynthesis C-methylase UbiE
MYDATAASYAKMMDAEIGQAIYADTLSRLAQRLAPLSGPLVDISCGSGHMLELYARQYDPERALVGLDLSPLMVETAAARLGDGAVVRAGDMRRMTDVAAGEAAGVLSFFAIHHLDPAELPVALQAWRRVLVPGGQLQIATWEGSGAIDYGDQADLIALRYGAEEVSDAVERAGFVVDRCVVEAVEDMEMQAIYLEATRAQAPKTSSPM